MEKYNISDFKRVLRGELSEQEATTLFQDPVFQEEFNFYLQLREGGRQLLKKYELPAEEEEAKVPDAIIIVVPLWKKIVQAVAAILILVGSFAVLTPEVQTMGAADTSVLRQFKTEIGLGLLILGAGVLFYFWKKRK